MSRVLWMGLVVLGVGGCRPNKADFASMEGRVDALAEQNRQLEQRLAATEATAAQAKRDAEQGIVERRRASTSVDELSLRVDELEKAKKARARRPSGPDPDVRYRVELGDAHAKGSSKALVTVVVWSDFQCPFCARVVDTLEQVEREYDDDVRFVYKHNPLAFHKQAMPAAIAAEAAGRQGKFWKMHDLLFEHQKQLGEDKFLQLAKKLKLNRRKFKRDMADGAVKDKIEAQQRQGVKLGARGTPAFFINGRFLSGAQPFDRFKTLIDAELVVARELVDGGTSRNKVYDVLMRDAKSPSS